MLKENLKQLRIAKGWTQAEFALQLNVVRQTVSKWENGLSVPDCEMLVEIAERLEVPVSTLLGETVEPTVKEDAIQVLADKLAALNEQLAKSAAKRRRVIRAFSYAGIAIVLCCLLLLGIQAFSFPIIAKMAGTSLIGGADGPTSIFLASRLHWPSVLGIVAILAVSVYGICATRRK